jgi:hypothetical protein
MSRKYGTRKRRTGIIASLGAFYRAARAPVLRRVPVLNGRRQARSTYPWRVATAHRRKGRRR